MKLVPLEDRVVVKVMEQEEKTSSGIVLPDTAKEKPSKGTVIGVGPGKYNESGKLLPMPVKEGDIVVFAKYGGSRDQARRRRLPGTAVPPTSSASCPRDSAARSGRTHDHGYCPHS